MKKSILNLDFFCVVPNEKYTVGSPNSLFIFLPKKISMQTETLLHGKARTVDEKKFFLYMYKALEEPKLILFLVSFFVRPSQTQRWWRDGVVFGGLGRGRGLFWNLFLKYAESHLLVDSLTDSLTHAFYLRRWALVCIHAGFRQSFKSNFNFNFIKM